MRENLKLGYDASARTSAFDDRLEKMADLFPLIRARLTWTASTLPGGEQAMEALARGLIRSPKLVVMDEPSLGLSPKLIAEYFDVVRRIRQEGATVPLIEQNAEMARRLWLRA